MNVTLDPRDQEALEALAQAEGKDAAALLRELVQKALKSRARNGSSDDEKALATRQREALRHLHQRLDAMPLVRHMDGLSGSRNHDAILYGKRS